MNKLTKEVLLPALRQHQHNDYSGLTPAYDYSMTHNIVDGLLGKVENLELEIDKCHELLCNIYESGVNLEELEEPLRKLLGLTEIKY